MEKENGRVILVVDDDAKLRALLKEYLEEYGFIVQSLPDGERIVQKVQTERPALIILDVMMPGRDGFEVLRELRSHNTTPVIMLTAKGEDSERIVGLEVGADDYLSKPFNPRELLARIKAILRRQSFEKNQAARHDELEIEQDLFSDGLTLNIHKQILSVDGEIFELSTTETRLMSVFMSNPNVALSRDELMNMVWNRDYVSLGRNIDVHVSKLRSFLRSSKRQKNRIKTVWGVGYLFVKEL